MDEAKVHEIRAWLTKALHDLQAAERLLIGPDPLCDAAAFHCQQAAEKALKAYLTWRDERFEKTHSLVALVARCLRSDASFEELRTAATSLAPYAVALRYPGEMPNLTETHAREALAQAHVVWNFVRERLPPEAHVGSKLENP